MLSKNVMSGFLLIVCLLFLFNGYAADNDKKENMAINYLMSTLKSSKFYSKRFKNFPNCILFITDEITNKYVEIELREKHEGNDCPGDPNFAPRIDTFRIYTTSPKHIDIYDIDGTLKPLNKVNK